VRGAVRAAEGCGLHKCGAASRTKNAPKLNKCGPALAGPVRGAGQKWPPCHF
jgi:hypothetical protein